MFTLAKTKDFLYALVGFTSNRGKVLSLVLGLLLIAATPTWADVYGRVAGTVKDPSGASVPGATVVLLNIDKGVQQSTTSDDQGAYAFPAVPVGHYDLEIRKAGFADERESGLIIDVNTVRIVDVALKLKTDVQEVTVNVSPVQVETASTQMGEVISDTRMESVPLNGRSYTDLLSLQPGVVPLSSGEASSISVNGGRESTNAFMVNGGNVEEGQFMGPAITPNLDSIAEFRIITNTFDAEYGEYSGAQVNVATKSGGNKFHGSGFDFLRNSDLDAAQYFASSTAVYIQNQFGGTVGGPIVPKKLFFFADYQGTRNIQGQSTGEVFVPSAAERTGDFSAVASQLTGTVNGSYWAGLLSQQLGYTVTAGEPYYTAGCTSNTVCVLPNAQIPQASFNPISSNILPNIPNTLPNENYYSSSSEKQRITDNEGALRLDLDSKRLGNISAYYYDEGSSLLSPFGGNNLPGFPVASDSTSTMFNVGDTKTITPTVLNELRVHVMHLTSLTVPGGSSTVKLSSLGFVTGTNTEGIVVTNPTLEGLPPLSFQNFSIGVPSFLGSRFSTNIQLSDNFSIIKGKHSIKLGGVLHDDQIINKLFGANNGEFGFPGNETGVDIADFLLGAPGGYSQGQQMPLHMHAPNFGVFGEDSWRVLPSLTVNYGLRWDVPKPWSEANGQVPTIVPGLQSKVFPGAPEGYVFPGDPGIPNSMAPAHYNNFAPRVGIAYSPVASEGLLARLLGSSGQTSIHAGFGIFYTVFEEELANNEIGAAPFGDWYSLGTPSLFGTPFIDRPTGFAHPQPFPVPFPAPVSQSHPNTSTNWSVFEPIGSSPGFWYKDRVPYTNQYNLSIQRQIGAKNLVQVGYVGSEGHALITNVEANVGNAALCMNLSQTSEVASGSPTCGPFGEDTVYTGTDGTVYKGLRSPLGYAFTSDGLYETIGNSNYNSLQASWRHQSGPLQFLAGYTFSKSIDSGSGFSEMINPVNPKLNHALSSFDDPHNFVASYEYKLPLDKYWQSRLTSGWEIAGITHFASGLPISLIETDDHSLLGTQGAGAGSGADTPTYTPGPLHFTNPRSGKPYFNTSLFSPSPIGQIGTSKLRFFHGPGLDNTDLSFIKNTKFAETMSLQFRFELFNAFNHAQFANPSGNVNNGAGFGLITGSGAPRIGQAALKFEF
jgi:hypothetical protein